MKILKVKQADAKLFSILIVRYPPQGIRAFYYNGRGVTPWKGTIEQARPLLEKLVKAPEYNKRNRNETSDPKFAIVEAK